MPGRRPPIVGTAEVAKMFGVLPQRADQISRGSTFPRPHAVLAAGRFWRTLDVDKWGEGQDREVVAGWWED